MATPEIDGVRTRTGGRSARVRAAVVSAVLAELAEHGYAALSPTRIAAAAGVDRATIHRRWPTRARLAADAIGEWAAQEVRLPDSGDLAGDLRGMASAVVAALEDRQTARMVAALVSAAFEDDELGDLARSLWRQRAENVGVVLERAADRGELERPLASATAVNEALVAPIYFRVIIAHGQMDTRTLDRCVASACAVATG